ncbi:MAG: SDR family oxidoreductase [Alicyclobacillus sp.]|nr:SDR family oxidoreductase [Alicyclobacillus sp.]
MTYRIMRPENLFDISNRTYLVTGASSGIGRMIALHLAAIGARVAAVGRNQERLCQVRRESETMTGDILPLVADITDPSSLRAAVKQALSAFGALDGAVLAAGINIREPFLNVSRGNWETVLQTNLTGFFHCAQAVAQELVDRGGSIVGMGSLSSIIAYNDNAAYAASKAALTQLCRVMAAELATRKVRVNVVAPGRISTPLIESLLQDPSQMAWMLSRIPMQRLGQAEELIGPVQFLLSDAASYITGAVLVVDGGWHITA